MLRATMEPPSRRATRRRALLVGGLAAFVSALALAAGCASFGPPGAEQRAAFDERLARAGATRDDERTAVAGVGVVHWVRVRGAGPRDPAVLFVHGSPGSWDAFAGFLAEPELLSRAELAALDRPGFGESEPGTVVGFAGQAAAVVAVARALGRPVVLVGHSLGAPIAVRAALDAPDAVAGLVLVAPPLDPRYEKRTWYQKVADWGWVARRLPAELVTSNQELRPLHDDLVAMLPRWPQLRAPVVVVQGDDDALVSPHNVEFAQAHVPADRLRVVRLADVGHLIPWKRPGAMTAAIVAMLDATAQPATPRSSGPPASR